MNIIKKWKEPMSALTHFIALIIALPITVILVSKALSSMNASQVISVLIFGIALIMLYAASTIYHMLKVSPKISNLLRKFDHIMIYILIAGTYTPVCLIPLKGVWGYTLLALVWSFAFFGILLKLFWMNAPRVLSTALYVIMGWLALLVFIPLIRTIPISGILMLIAGGLTYTAGAIIYATKKPKLNLKFFGYHEIFHLFVMGGSFFHIIFMFKYILL